MTVNTKGIRIVADAILEFGDLYDQWDYGITEVQNGYKHAGQGVHNCNTPACVAGFTVQLLGNPEEYKKVCGCPMPTNTAQYAMYLLGIPYNYFSNLFTNWPEHWYEDEGYILPEVKDSFEGYVTPDHKDAHRILHRLADQFDNKTYDHNGGTQ